VRGDVVHGTGSHGNVAQIDWRGSEMEPRARTGRKAVIIALAVAALVAAGQLFEVASWFGDSRAGAATGTPLAGTFTVTGGSCSGGTASGTYLRMVLSGGSNSAGPFFSNSDSSCSDQTYTPLAPGTDGGLVTGSYQAEPSPAFDSSGNSLADRITKPVDFEGVAFSTSTNPTDPQTGLSAPAPSIFVSGSTLSGSVQSFGVTWNNQQFNQGSPKPDGSAPGNTSPVTGTYNASTGAYTLQWSSQVVGGPFNGFSAFWNLTGRFVPASGAAPSGASSGSGSAATSSGAAAAGSSSSSHATTGSSSSSSSGSGSGSGVGSGASAVAGAAGTTTTTPVSAASAAPAPASSTHTVLSSHTITSGGGGWSAPTWLVVLVGVLALLGVLGMLWSERSLRRLRAATVSR